MKTWTIQSLLEWTSQHFKEKGIESARLDAELLLADTLKCKRLDLYLKFDQPVHDAELALFKVSVVRRGQREPVAYILGRQEFYSRVFEIPKRVLIPRPETEHLVDSVLQWTRSNTKEKFDALEIGCGSGAIAVSLLAEEPRFVFSCLDIQIEACEVTEKNSVKHNVRDRVVIECADFEKWSGQKTFDVVVSNPPYVAGRVSDKLEPDVRDFEPARALFGGPEGTETLSRWIPKMAAALNPGGLMVCEIGYDQEEMVRALAGSNPSLTHVRVDKDLAGHPRVFSAQKII